MGTNVNKEWNSAEMLGTRAAVDVGLTVESNLYMTEGLHDGDVS